MPNFWPHDFATWVSTGGVLLGGLWWVLKKTVVSSIDKLRVDISDLKDELKHANHITDNHEIRITKLETWKHDKWEA